MGLIKERLSGALGDLPENKLWESQTRAANNSPPLWIFGKAGTGKTTVAHRIALDIYKSGLEPYENGYSCKENEPKPIPFMAYSLCREFQKASLDNEDYEPTDLLYIIDDVDKIKMTEFREEQFFIFFDRCLKLKRKLIVTSQKSIREFSEMFSGDFVGAINRRLDAIFKEVEL